MLNNSKLIVVNAAPNSGKDHAVKFMVEHYGAKHMEMKSKLFDAAISAAGVTRDEWFERYNNRKLKEEPWWKLQIDGYYVSPRQWLIHISETVLKPLFGEDVFGLMASKAMIEDNIIYAFSDGGFDSEIPPLIERVGEENSMLIKVIREGETFEKYGDSRSYLCSSPFCYFVTIENDMTNNYLEQIKKEVDNFLERKW